MTKRPTKKRKLAECYTAYTAAKAGTRPKTGAKDGSIQTRPTVPCSDLLEVEVLTACLKWLKARRIFCNRHDCGAGNLGHGYAAYGIKYSGDIHGILPGGRHFEIEVKRGKGGRLSAGQQKRMTTVQAAGGVYLVCHGVEELAEIMRELV